MRDIFQVLESTAKLLGYELVDHEFGNRGRLLRVFIDRAAPQPAATSAIGDGSGITLEDCEQFSRQLQRVLTVEGIDYDRLEVSSPGLDRVLKTPAHFRRFAGERAELRLRIPVNGRRRFTGIVRGASEEGVDFEVDGTHMLVAFANLEKARLVPKL